MPEIASDLALSKATVLKYIQGIDIDSKYKGQWFGKRGGSRRRKERLVYEANRNVMDDLQSPKREKLIMLITLYWCEGGKSDLNFMNSDPKMLRLYVFLLRELFSLEDGRIKLSIRLYGDMKEKEVQIKNYWANLLNIPLSNFGRSEFVKPGKKNKFLFGMCRVRVLRGGFLLKYLEAGRKQIASL